MIEQSAKECPFCGRKPQSVRIKVGHCQLHGEQMWDWQLKCVIPSCKVKPSLQGNYKDRLIEEWNVRLTPEEAEEKRLKGRIYPRQ